MKMRIKRALLSVSDKTGIVKLAQFLHDIGVEIISTGGTMKALQDAGIPVTYVSDVTGFPEIMDGRVKTLNPKIHGGILAVRSNPEHVKAMEEHGIKPIDLVVVNLYPFRETIAKPGVTEAEAIENIEGKTIWGVQFHLPRRYYYYQPGTLQQPDCNAAAAWRCRYENPQNSGQRSIYTYFRI